MTPTLSAADAPAPVPTAADPLRPRWELPCLAALLVGTAVLYLWNLSAGRWANAFYSAAAQAGASDWTAMLFGSSDAANAITADKTPAALWIIDVSVRLFGLNSWRVLVPQALEGVAAVALLYAAVRRVSGPNAALLAGAVPAIRATQVPPIAALREGAQLSRGRLGRLLPFIAAALAVLRAGRGAGQPGRPGGAWLAGGARLAVGGRAVPGAARLHAR